MNGGCLWAELESVVGASGVMRIARTTSSSDRTFNPFEWVAVAGDVSPISHYWDEAQRTAVRYPPNPGVGWVFDFAQRAWAPNTVALWAQVRRERDALLAACDWRVMPDAPTSADERGAWLEYRQKLRDITDQSDPLAVQWPAPPA